MIMEEGKVFTILSIDGGGIRGIIPAKFLAQLEKDLAIVGVSERVRDHVDMICGTSTGGVIALGLALGKPAQEMLDLYKKEASTIFKYRPSLWIRAHYGNERLEELLRTQYKTGSGEDGRMADLPTRVCIPAYDLLNASPRVFKTPHHPQLTNDQYIPLYQVAMASAAAPTYFEPYSSTYADPRDGSEQQFMFRVDGGVCANNPALFGLIEAHRGLGRSLEKIRVLSIGTGHSTFCEGGSTSPWGLMKKRWGIAYWLRKKRLIDLFMQAQAQSTHNIMNILSGGVGVIKTPIFKYSRITTELGPQLKLPLDAKRPNQLKVLEEIGYRMYQTQGRGVLVDYFDGRSERSYPTTSKQP